jgi:hypothetical protein
MVFQPWRALPGKGVLLLFNLFSAVALIYEGYNQGVYGAVSGTPGFIAMSGIGYDSKVTQFTKQAGLAAAYYSISSKVSTYAFSPLPTRHFAFCHEMQYNSTTRIRGDIMHIRRKP